MLRPVSACIVAALAAAVLLLSGCGSDPGLISKEDYTDAVANTRNRVDYALTQITVGHGTTAVLIERMARAAELIDDAASDFEKNGSAAGFADETERLAQAFHDLATQLDATASDAAQPGMADLLEGTNALEFPGWTTANHILRQLKRQGIAVEPIGSH